MDLTGMIKSINQDYETGRFSITISIDDGKAVVEHLSKLNREKVSIRIEKWREKRSGLANKLLWSCLGDIAKSMSPPEDKWDLYLEKLRKYGEFTTLTVPAEAVDLLKRKWRETEVVGDMEIEGKNHVVVNCYYGSSDLNTKQFSKLLEGVIYDMEELGIPRPPSKEMRRALEQLEKMQNEKCNSN